MLYHHPGGLVLTKRVVEYCAFTLGAKVVDVGCGTGTTVEYLRDICGLQAVGVDLSEARLEQGRERSAGLPLIQGAGEQLPFADASVDGAIAECSLSVMQHARRVVVEINRILIDGGKLGITDLYVKNPGDPSSTYHLSEAGSQTGYTVDKNWIRMLEENGFRVIVWEDQSIFLQQFVASYIMEHGSVEELWQCISCNDAQQSTWEGNKKVLS